jgi:hypothetical protein
MSYGTLISTITVGSGGLANIDLTSIPQIYTDLALVISGRFNDATGGAWSDGQIQFNATGTTGMTGRLLYGSGSGSGNAISDFNLRFSSSSSTANTFGISTIYIPNYTSGVSKSFNFDSITENNGSSALAGITAGIWANNSAITSIRLTSAYSTWAQYTTVSLYGINRTQAIGKPKAIGGVISYANNRWFHTFASSGTFSTKEAINIDALIIGGGGGGGAYDAGGGGAGGYQTLSTPLNTIGDYSVIVGAGGPGGIYYSPGRNGAPSNFLTTTSIGGGGGGSAMTYQGAGEAGNAGASGGGARARSGGNTGGTGTAGQGNNGGNSAASSGYGAGGGGGAGSVGGTGTTSANGNGGDGLRWIDGNYYAGGGGGAVYTGYGIGTPGSGGIGGGGAGGTPPVAGTTNTGGGGGGNRDTTPGATGGSGVVIISYPAN